MRNLDPTILGFLEYSEKVKKLKKSTTKDMRCTFGKVTRYFEEQGVDEALWEADLSHYIRYLNFLRQSGERGTGISKQLSQIRGLINYCWRTGLATRNVLEGFYVKDHSPRYVARFLSIEEIRALLMACSKKSRIERKERLMILMLYGLGLRTGELCGVSGKDVDVERQEIFVKGKFDIERRIPIPDEVWVEMLAFMHENDIKNGLLFKTEHKKRKLGVADVGDIVRAYVARAGLKGEITAKTLRHTFACHLIESGVDVAVISTLMGHKSPQETGVYLHAYESNKKEASMNIETYLNEEDE